MNWILAFLFLLPAGTDVPGKPSTFLLTGFVVKVTDGDTFVLLDSAHRQFRVRLNGIDAPERGQDFYQASRQSLGNMLQKKQVSVRYRKKDRYGRLLADVYVDGNTWINFRMIANGMSWHFKKYSSDKILADAERKARLQRLGLWQKQSPTAPWDYRRLSHPSGPTRRVKARITPGKNG
ncbi:thermonuclease family protein [Flavihumibacter solisilvae]|uniref:thermonuclease family protein n=1 Tax=Flavihumibacter solisilvae TaxID=1349421 RepID=UPI000691B1E8|nr:thermonuclease family protein [Flavihumibacter solisilvae]